MELSLPTKSQLVSIVKVALYVGVSAIIDYLISLSQGTQFGTLTPIINLVLVTLKQFVTKG